MIETDRRGVWVALSIGVMVVGVAGMVLGSRSPQPALTSVGPVGVDHEVTFDSPGVRDWYFCGEPHRDLADATALALDLEAGSVTPSPLTPVAPSTAFMSDDAHGLCQQVATGQAGAGVFTLRSRPVAQSGGVWVTAQANSVNPAAAWWWAFPVGILLAAVGLIGFLFVVRFTVFDRRHLAAGDAPASTSTQDLNSSTGAHEGAPTAGVLPDREARLCPGGLGYPRRRSSSPKAAADAADA